MLYEKINLHIEDKLGKLIIKECADAVLSQSAIFNFSDYKYNISDIKALVGMTGCITLSKLTIDSFEKEEYLVLSGRMENGKYLDPEICLKLFRVDSFDSDKKIFLDDSLISMCFADNKAQFDALVNQSV